MENLNCEWRDHRAMRKLALLLMTLWAMPVAAHHNPVVYDGKRTVTITGIVTAARFAFPHSRYAIEVRNDDGAVERWALTTEDPRDAKRLGFADELKAIKVGDTLTVVGWPSKINPREIRGHQLHYPNGRVVMMRRGNYIWTKDLRRIWRLRSGQEPFVSTFSPIAEDLPPATQVINWIDAGDAVSRIAHQITQENARLIAIDRSDGTEFPGVRAPFLCHTGREDFLLVIDYQGLSVAQRAAISNGKDFIARYNDLLSRYWEYDIESC